jgi:hypothetical protein
LALVALAGAPSIGVLRPSSSLTPQNARLSLKNWRSKRFFKKKLRAQRHIAREEMAHETLVSENDGQCLCGIGACRIRYSRYGADEDAEDAGHMAGVANAL